MSNFETLFDSTTRLLAFKVSLLYDCYIFSSTIIAFCFFLQIVLLSGLKSNSYYYIISTLTVLTPSMILQAMAG